MTLFLARRLKYSALLSGHLRSYSMLILLWTCDSDVSLDVRHGTGYSTGLSALAEGEGRSQTRSKKKKRLKKVKNESWQGAKSSVERRRAQSRESAIVTNTKMAYGAWRSTGIFVLFKLSLDGQKVSFDSLEIAIQVSVVTHNKTPFCHLKTWYFNTWSSNMAYCILLCPSGKKDDCHMVSPNYTGQQYQVQS